jgi:5-methylcytosine-specific restriction enzyme A
MSPRRPPKVCTIPGCPNLATEGKCPAHQAESRRASDQRRQRTSVYSGRQWRAFRRGYLSRNPLCSEPGCGKPATDIDHLDGLGLAGPRAYDEANLRPLCHSHHSRHTARTSPGGWNRRS